MPCHDLTCLLYYIKSKDRIPEQGIFFEGQIFDAYKFVSDLLPFGFTKMDKAGLRLLEKIR